MCRRNALHGVPCLWLAYESTMTILTRLIPVRRSHSVYFIFVVNPNCFSVVFNVTLACHTSHGSVPGLLRGRHCNCSLDMVLGSIRMPNDCHLYFQTDQFVFNLFQLHNFLVENTKSFETA